MHYWKSILAIVSIAFSFVLCNKEKNEEVLPISHQIPNVERDLLKASNQIGFNCFKRLEADQKQEDNLLISPINISLSINSLIYASDNRTKKDIKRYLNISHIKDSAILSSFEHLNSLFSGIDDNTQLNVSSQIALFPGVSVNKTFKSRIKKNGYINIINDEDAGFIEDLPSSKNSNSFQLINSVDFIAQSKFVKRTEESVFYKNPDKSGFIEMIVAESEFNYYSDLTVKAVEIPLGRGNFNLLLIMPQGNQTVGDVAGRLSDKLLGKIRSKFKVQPMEVIMPKLDLSGMETLKGVLKNSRMSVCFRQNVADFSKLTDKNNLFLSDFEHIVNINISGKQMDGMPSNSLFGSDQKEKGSFLIDHPFLFVIYEKYSDAVLFIGKIVNP